MAMTSIGALGHQLEQHIPASLDPNATAFDWSMCAGVAPIVPSPTMYPHYPEQPK